MVLFVEDLHLKREEDAQLALLLGTLQLAQQTFKVRSQMVFLEVDPHPAGAQIPGILDLDQLLDRELD